MTVNAADGRGHQKGGAEWYPALKGGAEWYPALVAALVLALMGGTTLVTAHGPVPLPIPVTLTSGPVYTVTQVWRQVAHHPAGSAGRVVLVRGRAVTYRTWSAPDSIVARLELIDPQVPSGMARLSLGWGRPDPLLAGLRRLPLVGRLAPRPQRPRWGATAVYRVQLLGVSRGTPPPLTPCCSMPHR